MKKKVFVIGFQKTGTTSLELALKRLGYKVYGGDKNLLKFEDKNVLKKYINEVLSEWDAVQDMPWPLYYKELYELYPDALFILTLRDSVSWINSVVKYFASIKIPLHQKIYNVPCAEGYEERYLEVYEMYNEEIQGFFEGKDNFLIMRPKVNFDYETLCEFLNIDNLLEPFPHARNNANRKLPNYKWYRDLRSIYWNFKKNY